MAALLAGSKSRGHVYTSNANPSTTGTKGATRKTKQGSEGRKAKEVGGSRFRRRRRRKRSSLMPDAPGELKIAPLPHPGPGATPYPSFPRIFFPIASTARYLPLPVPSFPVFPFSLLDTFPHLARRGIDRRAANIKLGKRGREGKESERSGEGDQRRGKGGEK